MRKTLLLITSALATFGCAEQKPAEPPTRLIAWTTVEEGGAQGIRSLTGVVESALKSDLTFEVPGKVASIQVDTGDRFRRGQTLAVLERANYALRLQERKAALATARASFDRARSDFERHKTLLADGAVTASRFDNVKAEYESAKAQAELAEASVGLAQESLSDTRIVAPYDGSVTARYSEPAEQVGPERPVLSIQRRDAKVEIEVRVPETLITRLRVGDSHPVRVPALPEVELQATLTRIGTEATQTASFPVTLELNGAPDTVRAGMTAEVDFNLNAEDTAAKLRIPLAAFIPAGKDGYAAFVFSADSGEVTRTPIVIDSFDGEHAVVSSGLNAGDVVATRGLSFLTSGQKVELLGDGPARFDPPQRKAALGKSEETTSATVVVQ
ncbi:MAG: efflux RND transporter periplasmic adaptor subunit [Myxococcota bacterium]